MRGYAAAYQNRMVSAEVQADTERWRTRMQENFVSMLTAKPYYLQLRLIGLDNQGLELVRAERLGNRIETVPDDQLQSKGHTNYFKEGIKLPPGEVYLSDVNLNREYDQISEPHTPVMRAVAPVYTNEHTLFGIIVINIDFNELVKNILVSEHGGTTYLLNQHGDFLVHPAPDKEYAFEYGKRYTSVEEFGIAVERLDSDHDFIRYNSHTYPGEEAFGLAFHRFHFDSRHYDRTLVIVDTMPIKTSAQ